jgi:hypothetical protein
MKIRNANNNQEFKIIKPEKFRQLCGHSFIGRVSAAISRFRLYRDNVPQSGDRNKSGKR